MLKDNKLKLKIQRHSWSMFWLKGLQMDLGKHLSPLIVLWVQWLWAWPQNQHPFNHQSVKAFSKRPSSNRLSTSVQLTWSNPKWCKASKSTAKLTTTLCLQHQVWTILQLQVCQLELTVLESLMILDSSLCNQEKQ